MWIHDDILPSSTLNANGRGQKGKPCKVRPRAYVTQRITNWLQVNGRQTRFGIRIRFPYAMKEAVRAAAREITEKFESSSTKVQILVASQGH